MQTLYYILHETADSRTCKRPRTNPETLLDTEGQLHCLWCPPTSCRSSSLWSLCCVFFWSTTALLWFTMRFRGSSQKNSQSWHCFSWNSHCPAPGRVRWGCRCEHFMHKTLFLSKTPQDRSEPAGKREQAAHLHCSIVCIGSSPAPSVYCCLKKCVAQC